MFRNEANTETRCYHILYPVLAFAAIANVHVTAALLQQVVDGTAVFAVRTQEIALAIHFRNRYGCHSSQTMARWTSNDKALTIKRCYFERSGEAHGRSHHCNIDLALLQAGGELFGTPFDDAQTDIGAAHLEFRKKTREAAGTNRAHDPCDQLRLGRERLSFRLPRDLTQAGHDLLKPR